MNVIIKSAMFWLFCTCFHLSFLFQLYSEMQFTFNRFTAINNVTSLFMNVGLHNVNINKLHSVFLKYLCNYTI